VVRYAEYTPSRADAALWWLLRPVRWAVLMVERAPILASWWDRRAGEDYTGWTVRNLRASRAFQVGEVGVVTGYELQGRRRYYTIRFDRADLITVLPSPGDVALVGPSDNEPDIAVDPASDPG